MMKNIFKGLMAIYRTGRLDFYKTRSSLTYASVRGWAASLGATLLGEILFLLWLLV